MACPHCSDSSDQPGQTPMCRKCGFSNAPAKVKALIERAEEMWSVLRRR